MQLTHNYPNKCGGQPVRIAKNLDTPNFRLNVAYKVNNLETFSFLGCSRLKT